MKPRAPSAFPCFPHLDGSVPHLPTSTRALSVPVQGKKKKVIWRLTRGPEQAKCGVGIILLPHTVGPAGWSPAWRSQNESPHLAQLPVPILRTPHKGAGLGCPRCWMLPAQGSDSFCCLGLWVWMSCSFLASAAAALLDQGLLLLARRSAGWPAVVVLVHCAVSDRIRPQTWSKTTCLIPWFPRNPVAGLASRNPVHRAC